MEPHNTTIIWKIVLFFLNFFSLLFGFKKSNSKQKAEKIEELKKNLDSVKSYDEYKRFASEYDKIVGNDVWKREEKCGLYDVALLKHKTDGLKQLKAEENDRALMFYLREGLLRKIGGIHNPKLYDKAFIGTKELIEEYITEITVCLDKIKNSSEIDEKEKFSFFYETRQSFGRSALLLSGGASLGIYHLGIVKALFEQNLLPRVISGSSVGSVMASLISIRTDKELPELFEPGSIHLNAFEKLGPGSFLRKVKRLFKHGVLMDIKKLEESVRHNLGDITFKEAYDRTGRILNITVASESNFEFPRLLNYLTAPHVLIWSACSASCALAFLFSPVTLKAKNLDGEITDYDAQGLKWTDGSVATDLPIPRLSELFNVNFFIVSQVNPHMIPYLNTKRFISFKSWPTRISFYLFWSEIQHRVGQLFALGFLPLSAFTAATQEYEGDITIVPPFNLTVYAHLVSNPSQQIIQFGIEEGWKASLAKIHNIQQLCRIERTLEFSVNELRQTLYPQAKYNGGIIMHQFETT